MGSACHPASSAGPWIARLFTGNLPAEAHPEFRERAALRVSTHLLIRRDGAVEQYVSFNDRAWHAGKSVWQGREACNDYSIGIECEGTDEVPYEPAQYETLRALLPVLLDAYAHILASGSSATATSPRAARPIRDRHLTGRGYAELRISGGFHDQEIVARIVGLPVRRIGTGCWRLPG